MILVQKMFDDSENSIKMNEMIDIIIQTIGHHA